MSVPSNNRKLACGTKDGHVNLVTIGTGVHAVITTVGNHAREHPVDCIAAEQDYLATGGSSQVRVWSPRHNENGQIWEHTDMPDAPSYFANRSGESVVSSVCWVKHPELRRALLVCYVHVGIVVLDVDRRRKSCWRLLPYMLAGCTLVKEHHLLVVTSIETGFHIYGLHFLFGDPHSSNSVFQQIDMWKDGEFPVPSAAAHDGNAILLGSTTGQIDVWDTRRLKRLCIIGQDDVGRIWSLASHNFVSDNYHIIARSSGSGRNACVDLWQGQVIQRKNYVLIVLALSAISATVYLLWTGKVYAAFIHVPILAKEYLK